MFVVFGNGFAFVTRLGIDDSFFRGDEVRVSVDDTAEEEKEVPDEPERGAMEEEEEDADDKGVEERLNWVRKVRT